MDAEDYEKLSKHRWHSYENENNIYAQRTVREGKKTRVIFMHREIIGAEKGQMVDHINRNALDNRKSNLRLVTPSQSSQNARPISGYKGVGKAGDKWRASITKDGKYRNIGIFSDPEDAARAYDKVALELFGEHACTNEKLGLLSDDAKELLGRK